MKAYSYLVPGIMHWYPLRFVTRSNMYLRALSEEHLSAVGAVLLLIVFFPRAHESVRHPLTSHLIFKPSIHTFPHLVQAFQFCVFVFLYTIIYYLG